MSEQQHLAARLEQAAGELEQVARDWKGIVYLPTLADGQAATVAVLREAAAELRRLRLELENASVCLSGCNTCKGRLAAALSGASAQGPEEQ